MFIDATYEGDLMAAAGVPYTYGREANSQYGESWNGIQVGTLHHGHWFKKPIDPYVEPGKPQSGLLPRISAEPPGIKGEADRRIQAYCYRMCLTNHAANRRAVMTVDCDALSGASSDARICVPSSSPILGGTALPI